MSNEQRAAVVAEARSWIGTPYHHAADVKRHGVDCAMLLVRVYADVGLISKFDPRPYTRDWFLHRSEERYLGFLLNAPTRSASPVLAMSSCSRSGAASRTPASCRVSTPLAIIHAFVNAHCVVEDIIESNAELGSRLKTAKFASFWGG